MEDSKEVTILPETVELHKAKKTGARRKALVDIEEWMTQADEIVEAAGSYVGRQIDLGDDTKTDSRIETIITVSYTHLMCIRDRHFL